jgi:hypothetical protein
MRGLDMEDVWGQDPIHLKQLVYLKIADGVIRMSRSFTRRKESDQKRRRTDSIDDGASGDQNARRGRCEDPPRREWNPANGKRERKEQRWLRRWKLWRPRRTRKGWERGF